MKKLFLLAAIAAPFALFADELTPGDATTTPPAEPKPLLGYAFPAGSFFTIGESPVAILPWSTEQTFTNISAFQGEPYVDGDWYWQCMTYQGLSSNPILYGAKADYTYSSQNTAIPTNFGSVESPILYDMTYNSEGGRDLGNSPQYQWNGKIAFGNIAEGGSTVTVYNPSPALAKITKGESELYVANGSADNEWYNMYSNLYSSVSVEGFAQCVAYPGRPYTISNLTINTAKALTADDSFTVSIYEAPTEGTALPEQPITSQIVKAKAGKEHLISFINTPTVTSDIIIVINEFSTPDFQPSVAIAEAKEGATNPTNEGLMALARLNNEELANNVLSWDEAIDGALPVALDMTLDVKYVFFYPYMESPSSSEDPTIYEIGEEPKIEFANGTNWIQLICKSSTTDPNALTITLADGSELPFWLTVEALEATGSNTEVLINFICNNTLASGNAIVRIQVPGNEYALFNVVIAPTTGIDSVASDAAIVAREYYDLSGRRLAKAPTSGLFIEKSIRADGTSTSATRAN